MHGPIILARFTFYLMEVVEHVEDLPDPGVEPDDVPVLLEHLVAGEEFDARLARDEGAAPQQGDGGRPRGQPLPPGQAVEDPDGQDGRCALVKPLHVASCLFTKQTTFAWSRSYLYTK